MFEETINRPSRWRTFWPEVGDLSGAREAIRLGVWFAYLAAILGAIVAAITLVAGGNVVPQVANAVILGLIGLGIQHVWRTVAVFGATAVGFSIVSALAQGQFPGVVAPFVLVGLINGVRGTFAFKRLARAENHTVTTS